MLAEQKKRFLGGCLKHIACTPNLNEDAEEYRNGVLVPYQNIAELMEAVEKGKAEPGEEELRKIFGYLLTALRTKQVPLEEQIERVDSLLKESGADELLQNDWLNSKHLIHV